MYSRLRDAILQPLWYTLPTTWTMPITFELFEAMCIVQEDKHIRYAYISL